MCFKLPCFALGQEDKEEMNEDQNLETSLVKKDSDQRLPSAWTEKMVSGYF